MSSEGELVFDASIFVFQYYYKYMGLHIQWS